MPYLFDFLNPQALFGEESGIGSMMGMYGPTRGPFGTPPGLLQPPMPHEGQIHKSLMSSLPKSMQKPASILDMILMLGQPASMTELMYNKFLK